MKKAQTNYRVLEPSYTFPCMILHHPPFLSSQLVEVFSNDAERQSWLFNKLANLVDEGDVIIFAGQIARVDGLTAQLQAAGVKAGAIHGDMDQVCEFLHGITSKHSVRNT